MRRVRHSKSGLFLIELMICILFFSCTAGICIRFFAKSHELSQEARNLYQAQQEASSIETTVQTTQKTSTKKKSKVKTIKTTVVTTVKTTETNLGITTSKSSNEASDNTADATSGFAINDFSDIKGHVDSRVYNAFVNLGFGFKVNSKLSTTGVFSVRNHNIQLKRGQSSYLLHELGHFVAALKGRADQTSEFKKIYNTEKNAYVGNNKAYVTQDAGEYFAESFRDYTENVSALKSQRPQTYNYINGLVNSISDKDVSDFYNAYGWYWN